MKVFGLVAMVFVLGGCVSASTSNRLCSDFGVISKVVSAISEKAGQAIGEYTPKKCLNASVSGDSGNLTGGVSAGISNENVVK